MAELEAELQAQLAEQEEAVVGVKQLLEDDPDSEEIGALLAELQVCVWGGGVQPKARFAFWLWQVWARGAWPCVALA